MNLNFIKNIVQKYKRNYPQMFTLALSLAFLGSICFALICINNISFLGFMALIFIFFPLMLSMQLVYTRFQGNYEVKYNEIYKNYKAFYNPIFRGVYGLIISFLIFFITYNLANSIYIYLHVDIDEITKIMNANDMDALYDLILSLTNTSSYEVFSISFIGLSLILFLIRVFSRCVIPYFNYILGTPTAITKKIIKSIKNNNNSNYRKKKLTLGFPLFFIFIISYYSTAFIAYYAFNVNSAYVIIIATSLALILSSFYIPIYMMGSLEIVIENRNQSLLIVKEIMTQEFSSLLSSNKINTETKEKIKNIMKNFQDSENKDNDDNKDDNKN